MTVVKSDGRSPVPRNHDDHEDEKGPDTFPATPPAGLLTLILRRMPR